MCTMTWFNKDDGYELFFNRDEQLSRRRAELPTLQTDGTIQYLSPTDADAGGTWITVNQFGVSVCLLNHYQFQQIETYKQWTSRGEIVRMFAGSASITQALLRFNKLDLANYRAFRMFILERTGQNALLIWDGHLTRIERNVATPKSSSSVNAKYVKATRKQYFHERKLPESKQTDDYLAYHASHFPVKSEQSVCMHREDANTVSLSHVRVDACTAQFSYADGAPCETELGPAMTLELVDHLGSVIPFAITK